MHKKSFRRLVGASRALVAAAGVMMAGAACSSPGSAPASAPAAQVGPAAAPAAKAAPVVTLLEPAEGLFAGHVESFRWSPVEGADGYHLKVSTMAGRVVWESPLLTSPEARLPATVALEPEAHAWQVTAMKGAEVLATSAAGRFTVTP